MESLFENLSTASRLDSRTVRYQFPKRGLQAWAQMSLCITKRQPTEKELYDHIMNRCRQLSDLSAAHDYRVWYSHHSEKFIIEFYLTD